ncbi:MAG: hypothetical protein J6Q74_00710 [Clostridia bacterium]|nr:hypothetical protein [Clostridia bacterium]
MITAIILIYTALTFALGVMVGSLKRRGEEIMEKPRKTSEYSSEILNFLNYDGSEQ